VPRICYHLADIVRQLITRLDDELLARLKRRAAAEGRSVNALVTEILASQLAARSPKAELRLRGGERIVRPPRPTRAPSRETVRRASRGWGDAVSKALMEERAAS
jgi:plasmid stability protein